MAAASPETMAVELIREQTMTTRNWCLGLAVGALVALGCATLFAGQDTDKDGIPPEHLKESCKTLPWGVEVWGVEEAVVRLNNGVSVLWVDTRPDDAYKKGSLRDAVPLPYDSRTGGLLGKDRLDAAIKARGFSASTVKIAFFEDNTCARSYHATRHAVVQWGIDPKNVVWFRDGYPQLLREVKENPLLKRKARFFLNDVAMSQL